MNVLTALVVSLVVNPSIAKKVPLLLGFGRVAWIKADGRTIKLVKNLDAQIIMTGAELLGILVVTELLVVSPTAFIDFEYFALSKIIVGYDDWDE